MNHRKQEHTSNKICRYYLEKMCIWEADACWYKHVNTNQPEEMETESANELSCNNCEERFVEERELRKHMKRKHPNLVPKCRDFRTGTCGLANESCWFVHEQKTKKDEQHQNVDETINEEANAGASDSVFHEAMNRTPPDLMIHIVKMLTELSMQMKNWEKMAQKNN